MLQARRLASRRAALALGITACLAASLCGCQADHVEERGPRAASPIPGRGEATSAHLTLTGAYVIDRDGGVVCAFFPNQSLQVTFRAPQAPFVILYLKDWKGAGPYEADARIRATYSGETIRVSRGPVHAEIQSAPGPQGGDVLAGSFSGTFNGEAGKGTVAGKFAGCLYKGLPKT